MTDDPPPAGSRGSGLMLTLLIGFALLCAGSVVGVGCVVWRVVQSTVERAADEKVLAEEARQEAEEQEVAAIRQRFQTVATAMAQGLKDPDRLSDSYTADGKPLLSWRVHLLPRLGEQALYLRFNLKEPWDGPTNKPLIPLIPAVYDYQGPRADLARGATYFRGFSHEGAIFEPNAHFRMTDLPAAGDRVLALIDACVSVEWTCPDGHVWPVGAPTPFFGGTFGSREVRDTQFLAATATGRVVVVDPRGEAGRLRARFDRRVGADRAP